MSGSDFAYGQGTPDDFSEELSVVAFICRQLIERLDVMKLVKVSAVHPGDGSPPAAGTVDVIPLVNQIDGNRNPVPHGTVYGVPYWRFQFGKWAIIADPGVGDVGYVVCADRDSSLAAKNSGQQVNPGSLRRYDVADGVYVGGCLNAVPAATFWLKTDGTLEVTDSKGNVLETSSNGFAMTGNLAVTGDITATGDVIANSGASQVSLQNHLHSGVTTGAGDSGPPVPGT